jgi:putative DNA methylase
LPHLDQPGLIQAITFRLHDALPQPKVEEWQEELELSSRLPEERERELRWRIETYLDAGHGACWLKELRIGHLVEEELLHFDGERYQLLAWCVMPNHVHTLIQTRVGWDLARLVQSWKSRSAYQANKVLGRTGSFWQREYFDRFIRDGSIRLTKFLAGRVASGSANTLIASSGTAVITRTCGGISMRIR